MSAVVSLLWMCLSLLLLHQAAASTNSTRIDDEEQCSKVFELSFGYYNCTNGIQTYVGHDKRRWRDPWGCPVDGLGNTRYRDLNLYIRTVVAQEERCDGGTTSTQNVDLAAPTTTEENCEVVEMLCRYRANCTYSDYSELCGIDSVEGLPITGGNCLVTYHVAVLGAGVPLDQSEVCQPDLGRFPPKKTEDPSNDGNTGSTEEKGQSSQQPTSNEVDADSSAEPNTRYQYSMQHIWFGFAFVLHQWVL